MKDIWIVGSGAMAREHARVMLELANRVLIIGRNQLACKLIKDEFGIDVWDKGLKDALVMLPIPKFVIVATSVDSLFDITMSLLSAGVGRVLVEKPAALQHHELRLLYNASISFNSELFVAYNRRFFPSVQLAKQYLNNDGGAKTISYEFTERSEIVGSLVKPYGVRERWLLSNSTHVIDTAFFLAGTPTQLSTWSSGELSWHKNGARFSGAGQTNSGALFSYIADWDAPGAWSITVTSKKYRLTLSPMERLIVSSKKSQDIYFDSNDESVLNDRLNYKTGVYEQDHCFLTFCDEHLCTIKEHLINFEYYIRIANYD